MPQADSARGFVRSFRRLPVVPAHNQLRAFERPRGMPRKPAALTRYAAHGLRVEA